MSCLGLNRSHDHFAKDSLQPCLKPVAVHVRVNLLYTHVHRHCNGNELKSFLASSGGTQGDFLTENETKRNETKRYMGASRLFFTLGDKRIVSPRKAGQNLGFCGQAKPDLLIRNTCPNKAKPEGTRSNQVQARQNPEGTGQNQCCRPAKPGRNTTKPVLPTGKTRSKQGKTLRDTWQNQY